MSTIIINPRKTFTNQIILDELLEPYKDILFETIESLSEDEFEILISNWSQKHEINHNYHYMIQSSTSEPWISQHTKIYFDSHNNCMYLNPELFTIMTSKAHINMIASLFSTPFRTSESSYEEQDSSCSNSDTEEETEQKEFEQLESSYEEQDSSCSNSDTEEETEQKESQNDDENFNIMLSKIIIRAMLNKFETLDKSEQSAFIETCVDVIKSDEDDAVLQNRLIESLYPKHD